MIVYGVSADVSITRLFIAGVIPGLLLAGLFMGYTIVWSLLHPERIPPPDRDMTFGEKVHASRHLIPVVGLIVLLLGSIYLGIPTATQAPPLPLAGPLA